MPEKGHRHFIKCEGILMEASSELSLTIIFPERGTMAEEVAIGVRPFLGSGQCILEHLVGNIEAC